MRDLPASVSVTPHTVRFDGAAAHDVAHDVAREIAVEVPVNVLYATGGAAEPFAVMMCTPADLEDFAYGFSFTEGVIAGAGDIERVTLMAAEGGYELVVSLSPSAAPRATQRLASRSRNTSGRTGCGICGIDTLEALPLAAVRAPATRSAGPVSLAAIHRALTALDDAQRLNQRTHAVHGAAWCNAHGNVVLLREDVGRHNALDKCIGALLRAGVDADGGFLVITSRCSFEMVEKAAAFGAHVLVAISAPTSLAVERAERHDMTMLAVARRDSALVFTGAQRVVADTGALSLEPVGAR